MQEIYKREIERKLLSRVHKPEEHELTPATRLLERRREMLDVESGLVKLKDEFALKMESISTRRLELGRKEILLKESLLKFEKFLRENDAKRLRAVKKASEEKKIKEVKEIEIMELKESQNVLLTKKEKQSDTIESNLSFHFYLESLTESNSEYVEVNDIISRFDTLSATNLELLERFRIAQEKTEHERIAFQVSLEEKSNLILNSNNQIAKMQANLEDKRVTTIKWQSELDELLKSASQKSLLLGQVKM